MARIINIKVNGKEYKARMTMGAMLRFKRETGKEVDQIDAPSDMITFIWCVLVSCCAADKVEFPYSLEEFADNMDMEVLHEFGEAMKVKNGTADILDDEKKSQ